MMLITQSNSIHSSILRLKDKIVKKKFLVKITKKLAFLWSVGIDCNLYSRKMLKYILNGQTYR